MASKNKFYSYQTRLFFLIVIFTWILTFSFFTIQYTREREFKVENLNSMLQVYNTQILNAIENKIPMSQDLVDKIAGTDSLRVTIVNFAGKVIYDTKNDSISANHLQRNEIKEAMENGSGYTVRRLSGTNNIDYFYSATKGADFVVRTALPYDNSMIALLHIDTLYMWMVVIISFILTIIAFFATRRIGQSVKNLSDFANEAEKGDIMDYDTNSFPNDELGEISTHIINMYKNLEETTKQRDENLKQVLFEEQEKTRIKHQLSNNINHELKTPVHAIQGCLETIITNGNSLSPEMIHSLVEKSYSNVQRLSLLIHDIATITDITEDKEHIEKKPSDINLIVEQIKKDIMLLPPEKQMRMNIELPDNIKIVGNESLLEAIFRNLVNNAISYSGGRDIFIQLVEETADEYVFRIWDNGIGISPEHLSRVFERFYRVDSGRSRKLGGTGLGLAIVKNAVIFHNGTISVKNRKSGGLEFTFTLHK